ncbi:zinc-dependent alcohol dehydrogenase [Rothia uropygialis]|uniref:zinc-dependent alcohol dehydrogenase n=1 Tax=Kocuria sp. 36 TaxID=1415402 RepID=UPI00101CABD7|nr:alcohol dehydrogenase catalytic domain-containing protein [Kocuria sp. 36]
MTTETMRAVRTVAARTLDYVTVPLPAVSSGEALVHIEHVTLCGTDLHIFEDDYASELPLVQGHEISGTVAEVAPGVETVEVGDRVAVDPLIACGQCQACRSGHDNVCPYLTVFGCYRDGGLVEYLSVAAARLHRIPEGMPTELGSVAEPTAISLEAVARGQAIEGESALVLGAGPIGLLATLALHDLGVTVITADTIPDRLEFAREFGADGTLLIDPEQQFPVADLASALESSAPDGPQLVIEATGVPSSLGNAINVVAPAGRVVQVGISTRPADFPLNLLPFKEISLLGSRNSRGLIPRALDLISRYPETVDALITHRFDLRDLNQAFETMRDTSRRIGKILIDMPTKEAS